MTTSVRDYLAQPSLRHEPRPSRTPAATLVDGDEFDRLALTFGSFMELGGSSPQVVTADGRRFELERVTG